MDSGIFGCLTVAVVIGICASTAGTSLGWAAGIFTFFVLALLGLIEERIKSLENTIKSLHTNKRE